MYRSFFLVIFLLSFISCRNHYDIDGRIVNVCHEPLPGIPIIFAGCTNRGPGLFGESNTQDFEYSTFTDANGEFSFNKKNACDDVWITINGSSRSLRSDNDHIEDTIKGFHHIFLHFNLNAGDSIKQVFLMDPILVYPKLFWKVSDSLYQITFYVEKQKFKFKTMFYKNSVLDYRIDSAMYDCSAGDINIIIPL